MRWPPRQPDQVQHAAGTARRLRSEHPDPCDRRDVRIRPRSHPDRRRCACCCGRTSLTQR